jgi:glycogen operon protein
MGVHWDGQGLNIAVASSQAEAIELCLFDATGGVETHRARLPARSQDIWHGYLRVQAPGPLDQLGRPGQLYGFRAHGPWRPDLGQRFNPHKLLLDPYAREIVGDFCRAAAPFGQVERPVLQHDQQDRHDEQDQPSQPDHRDNAISALKARAVIDDFDWGDDRPPRTPLIDTVICELHVKGYTRSHPGVPEPLRGTFAGLSHDVPLAHLQSLGVTAVSLLPVHYWLDEQRLLEDGLSNYWGYNTLGFFCPAPRLAADPADARNEFRRMVRRLHQAGIEVLLDVVFNHSAESDEAGPTLSWRGLDNVGSYRLPPGRFAGYENYSGCGNTFDIRQPRVLQLVMDSLRFWVGEMHVDGFRFDLASVLGRGDQGFDRQGPFFSAIRQDPMLGRLWTDGKLIAEPWDVGPGGYQAGNFPNGWLEWNDSFRDTMRAFWLGGAVTRGQFAQALAGSAQRLQSRGREPVESVNYIVSHDGFTLRDLVSFDLRHNEANGENNRDGHGHNLSWNCGVEGETDDPEVLMLRGRLQRALLATLLLAQGTPMLAAGDEIGHSQRGNNNPYCQDNAITWIDWPKADASLLRLTAKLLALRRQWLPLRSTWYTGQPDARGLPDLGWLRRNGKPLTDWDWNQSASRVIGALIGAPGRSPPIDQGGATPLLMLFNAEDLDTDFRLPEGDWRLLLNTVADDTVEPAAEDQSRPSVSGHCALRARSVMLLVRQRNFSPKPGDGTP